MAKTQADRKGRTKSQGKGKAKTKADGKPTLKLAGNGKTKVKAGAAAVPGAEGPLDQGFADRYPLPEIATLPDDIRERILAVQEKSGFVPNVFLKLARRPAEFRAFFAYYDALMLKDGSLSKAEREMVVVATSALNSCLYCVVAHGAILRIYQKDPLVADQLATNYRKAPLPARQRAMLDFACKVAVSSATIDDEDYRRLQAHGFDAEDAWDIAAIAAFFALSNRIANASGMMPNPEFYTLGRTPAPRSSH